MKIELPVLIEHINDADGVKCHRVRPVFLEQPEMTNRNIEWAMQQLSTQLHERANLLISQRKIEEIVRWSHTPELRLTQLQVTLDLPRRFARIWAHVVTFEACGRVVGVCPYVASLPWFELEKKEHLESRTAEVMRKHYRELQKNFGNDALESELAAFGKKRTIRLSYVTLYLDQMRQGRKSDKSKTPTRKQELIDEGKQQLKQVGTNLNQLYPNGLHKAVCRDETMERLYQLLTRPKRKAVMLVGPPKVGKTAVIHSVVAKMTEQIKRPDHDPLRQTMWHLTPGRIISGMAMSGNWEARVSAIFAFAESRDVTLNFSQLLGLLNTGKSSQGNLAVADLLLQAVRRRRFRIVVELTEEQLHVLRERNRALADQFEILHITEPKQEDNIRMLLHTIRELEWKWKCRFAADLLPLVMDLTTQYEDAAALPGKAVEWLSALAMQKQDSDVTREDFLEAFREKTGLKLTYFNESNRTKTMPLEIETWFHSRIVGQQTAVETMRDIVLFADSMLADPTRPIASLFFSGPTGVGKTECAKRLAEYFFGSSEKLIRFDANELCTAQAVARLVGGTHRNGEGLLTGAIRRQPFSVVLFDEIEKGHPDLFDLLLQVIGEARLTDTMGRVASFAQAIVIFTSNLGTGRILEGFAIGGQSHSRGSHFIKAVSDFFRPEFINRIDRIIPFSPLSYDEREIIADRMLDEIANREGLRRRKCRLVITPQARDWIVKRETDSQYGARGVRRLLEQELVAPVSRFLAAASAENPVVIEVALKDTTLHVEGFELKQMPSRTKADWQNPDWLESQSRNSQQDILKRAKSAIRNMQENIAAFRPARIGNIGELSPTERLYFRLNDETASLRQEADDLLDLLDATPLSHVDMVPLKATRFDADAGRREGYRSFWKQFMNSMAGASAFQELFKTQERQSRLQHFLERLAKLHDAVKQAAEPPEQVFVVSFATDSRESFEPAIPGTLLGETWELETNTYDFGFGPQKIGLYRGIGVRQYWKNHEGSTLDFQDGAMHVRSVVALDNLDEKFNKWPPVAKIMQGKQEVAFRDEPLTLPEELLH